MFECSEVLIVQINFIIIEYPCNNNNDNNNLVWWNCHHVPTLQNVIQTQECEPCQLNKLSTPFPAEGFPSDTTSSTRPKAQTWPQFNCHAPDNNGWVKHHTQDTTDEFNVIPRTVCMTLGSEVLVVDEFVDSFELPATYQLKNKIFFYEMVSHNTSTARVCGWEEYLHK